MHVIQGAILAVALAAGDLDEPRHVRFRLADGVQVSGQMTAWDAGGFDGSFGRRLWTELMADDVWRLYVAVMDQSDASQWVDLGGALLLTPKGESWADRAFRRGLRLDPSVAGAVDAAHLAAEEARRRREETRREIESQRLRTTTPEAGPWPAHPWPIPSDADHASAVASLKDEARQILRQAGIRLEPVETDRFLVYAQMPPLETARLASRLEAIHERLAGLLGVDPGWNFFRGKAVVFVFGDQDRFRLVEAESFDQLVSRGTVGICHPTGSSVFLSFCGSADAETLARSVAHELVHGFMHRFRTARRLPPWANEGLAEYVAGQVARARATDDDRERALRFIRDGGDVDALLGLTYDEGWPDHARMGQAVGALLVELMIGERPRTFARWVDAVKYGKEWEIALAEDYGAPRGQLVTTFVQYYRVND